MRILLTGATGFVGSAVATELLAAGYEVVGLARSEEAEHTLRAAGVSIERGSLEDRDGLRAAAGKVDGVVHLAFNTDRVDFQQSCEFDRIAIETIGECLAGTGKTLVVPNGMAGIAPGRVVSECDDIPLHFQFPRASEQTALRFVSQGVAAAVVRLAQVHDVSKQGLITGLIGIARKTGKSAYVGEGANRWPAVHVSDAARLFRLVLEAAEPGVKYHAVAEEGVAMRDIAGVIADRLGIPLASIDEGQAPEHFGPFARFATADMPATSDATRAKLGWQPSGPALINDLGRIS